MEAAWCHIRKIFMKLNNNRHVTSLCDGSQIILFGDRHIWHCVAPAAFFGGGLLMSYMVIYIKLRQMNSSGDRHVILCDDRKINLVAAAICP